MLVFMAGITPQEYLHDLLYDHQDSFDASLKKGELVITNKHHHCSFLNFEYTPYLPAAQPVFIFATVVYGLPHHDAARAFLHAADEATIYLRGPPAVTAC